jgi:hypothetical protein
MGSPRRALYGRALAWLALLGPSFFLLYGWANARSANLANVPSIVWDWEHHIPFVPSFLLPYMSEDLFYAASLFLIPSRAQMDRHAVRLLAALLFSVACFVLFPLKCSFVQPPVEGFNALLLNALTSFDKPYNQAPSLHISLLVLLWVQYSRHLSGWVRRATLGWFALIGLSVLFTWQHHAIDVVLGLFAGFGVLYLLPDSPWRFAPNPVHRKLALAYGLGAVALGTAAFTLGGIAWWLAWPAGSTAVVSAGYAGLGPQIFQKGEGGRRSPAATVVLGPYLFAAWLNAKIFRWLKAVPPPVELGDLKLWPWPGPITAQDGVVSLCGELPTPRSARETHRPVSWLDLVVPSMTSMSAAVDALDNLRAQGYRLNATCALGRGRSAMLAAAWLLHTGRACSARSALDLVRETHPLAAIPREFEEFLERWREQRAPGR